MPIVDYSDLINRTFLHPDGEGEIRRTRIVEALDNQDAEREANPEYRKYRCVVDETGHEEVLTYNELLDHLEKDSKTEHVWKFRRIIGHEGPLRPGDKGYKGSAYNVVVEWENGEITTEPLTIIGKDDPVTVALYAKENGLLDQPGRKQFR